MNSYQYQNNVLKTDTFVLNKNKSDITQIAWNTEEKSMISNQYKAVFDETVKMIVIHTQIENNW